MLMRRFFDFFIIIILLTSPWPALSLTNAEVYTYYSMGYYYLFNGDIEMARIQFELCLRHQKEPTAHLYAILAEIASMQDNRREAKEYALKALDIDPQNEVSLQLLSHLMYEEQEYEKAASYLERLRQKRPFDLQVLYYLAEVYDQIDDEDRLMDVYRRIVQIDPDLVDAHLNLGYLFIKRGAFSEARKHYEKAIELDPENERAIFYLTYIYLNEGNTQEALSLFNKLYNKNLLNDDTLQDYIANLFIEDQNPKPILERIDREKFTDTTKAISAYVEGDLDRAQSYFEKVVEDNPGNIVACIGLVRIAYQKNNVDMEKKWRFVLAGNYYKLGRYESSLHEALIVKKLDPQLLENRYLLGDIYYGLGTMDKAVQEYEYFEAEAEDKGDVYVKLSVVYSELGNHKKAVEGFMNAIRLFPDNDELYYYLGIEYRIVEDYPNAIDAFKEAIALNDSDSQYYFHLGACYERLGDYDDAIFYLDKSISIDDTNPVALNYLGYILADRGIRLEEAKEYIEKALSMAPERSAYLDSMGWVYFRLARYNEAREYLEDAVKYLDYSDEENYLIYDHLGDVYYAIKLYGKALDAWKRALEMKFVKEIEVKVKKVELEMNQ